MSQLETPVLFMIFNRPDTTARVFAQIRKAQPKKLFIAADGARDSKSGEKEICMQTRQAVENVDWECEVQYLYRDQNLGCKLAVSGAINWFFSQVEEGIILEDDCLPHDSFFGYASELLARYRHDTRVMMVAGQNTQNGNVRGSASYYFSKFPHIWGWATWKRAWDKFDVDVAALPEFKRQKQIANVADNPAIQEYWMDKFELVHKKSKDTWDFQWVFTVLSNNGLVAMPNVNLVSNIGFDARATHTDNPQDVNANRPTFDIGTLTHPEFMLADKVADEYEAVREYFIRLTPYIPKPDSAWRKIMKKTPQPLKDAVKGVVGK